MKTNNVRVSLPESVAYTPLHSTIRTHKISDKRFAAVGALYWMGERGLYVSAVAATRRTAEKLVDSILDPKPNLAYRSEARLRAMECGL